MSKRRTVLAVTGNAATGPGVTESRRMRHLRAVVGGGLILIALKSTLSTAFMTYNSVLGQNYDILEVGGTRWTWLAITVQALSASLASLAALAVLKRAGSPWIRGMLAALALGSTLAAATTLSESSLTWLPYLGAGLLSLLAFRISRQDTGVLPPHSVKTVGVSIAGIALGALTLAVMSNPALSATETISGKSVESTQTVQHEPTGFETHK